LRRLSRRPRSRHAGGEPLHPAPKPRVTAAGLSYLGLRLNWLLEAVVPSRSQLSSSTAAASWLGSNRLLSAHRLQCLTA
jgi:hypothetical protein